MTSSYVPVQYVYREIIEEEIGKGTTGKIFYFNDHDVAFEARREAASRKLISN